MTEMQELVCSLPSHEEMDLVGIRYLYEDRITKIGDICKHYNISRYKLSKMAKKGAWIKGELSKDKYDLTMHEVRNIAKDMFLGKRQTNITNEQLSDIQNKYEDSETKMSTICDEYELTIHELRNMAKDMFWVRFQKSKSIKKRVPGVELLFFKSYYRHYIK